MCNADEEEGGGYEEEDAGEGYGMEWDQQEGYQ
jgi:hypothetical protein